VAPTWSIGHPWNTSFHFSFLILGQSVGLPGWGVSPSQGRYLHRTTQTQNKRTQTSMPWVGFEPTILVFERAKTVHSLDSAATVTGVFNIFFSLALQPQFGPWPSWNSPFNFGFLDLRQSVGLLGRVISSSQGLYLYANTEKCTHTHTHTNTKHPCLEWDSNPRSRLPTERRQFMP
jgi:hypothetical protein